MKKVKLYFSSLAICALLGVSTPVIAQQDNTTTTTTKVDDDDDGFDDWGLIGLLGLLGLLGRKKDDTHVVRRDTTVNR